MPRSPTTNEPAKQIRPIESQSEKCSVAKMQMKKLTIAAISNRTLTPRFNAPPYVGTGSILSYASDGTTAKLIVK
jgi:hypothetical protein